MDKPQPNNVPPAAPPGKVRVDFLADAKAKAAEARTKEPPKVEQKPAEPVKPAEPAKPTEPAKVEQPVDPLTKSYEKLAQEREQTRKMAEEVKAQATRYASIEKAIATKDVKVLLGLAGITPEELVKSISGAKSVEVEKAEPPKPPPELEEVRKELAELKAKAEAEQLRATTTQVLNAVQNELKTLAEKLPLASRLPEESAQEALKVMEDHFRRTGQNLAEDARESIRLALELVEERHQAVVRKYGLTPTPKQASIMPGTPEAPPAVESVALTQEDERPSMREGQPRILKAEDYRARVKAALRNRTPGA